jgi:hypothetical protein
LFVADEYARLARMSESASRLDGTGFFQTTRPLHQTSCHSSPNTISCAFRSGQRSSSIVGSSTEIGPWGASRQTVNTLERKDRALSSARSRPAGQPLANHLPKRAAREFAFNSEFAYHVRFAMFA